MKRILFFLLTLTAALSASAHDFEVNGIYYVKNSDGTSVSVSFKGETVEDYSNEYSGNVNIPPSVTRYGTTYPVTEIHYSAFFRCSKLTSVTIPNSVTSIGYSAFLGCSSLKSVTIGNSVTFIGENAFSGCSGLTKVEISDLAAWCRISFINDFSNPLYYAHHLYMNGSEIKDLVIPNSVTSINNSAFRDCRGLTSVTIPNSVTSIGKSAFNGCIYLTKVEISDLAAWCRISFGSSDANPLYYANHLFLNGSEIKDLVIPNSVTSIGDYAFSSCSGLTSATIPNSVTSIGDYAFSSCSGLTSIVVESGNTAYDSRNNCNAIIETSTNNLLAGCKNTTIPNSVTSIGNSAFRGCKNMKSITIPNSVTSIGNSAFDGCSGLTSATIPNSVTSIGSCAFEYCSGLTSVTIGYSVTSIGNYAFYGCSGLKTVNWNAKNCADFSSESTPFRYNKAESSHNYTLTGITTFNFGNEVEKIPAYLCYQLSGLTSVTIPNSVTSIGDYAFSGCSGLKTIINGASEPQAISSNAFSGVPRTSCKLYVQSSYINRYKAADVWKSFDVRDISEVGIVVDGIKYADIGNALVVVKNDYQGDIVIPEKTVFNGTSKTVVAIDSKAFYNCGQLTKVSMPNSVTEIGEKAFDGCDKLTVVNMGDSVRTIGDDAFNGCQHLITVTIPKTLSSLGARAFNGCASLFNVNWNAINCDDISASDYAPFNGLSGITTFNFGNEVEKIPNYLCYGLSGLKSVTIPNSVTSIGSSAFEGCSGLTSVTIPNSVSMINSETFSGCSGLNSVSIPNSVTSIGSGAFNGCSGLTSITIPNAVTEIDDYTFSGCSGLTSVTIPYYVTSIGSSAFQDCRGLTSITIPNAVTEIDGYAFSGCSGLTSVTVGNSVNSIGENAFDGSVVASLIWNAKNCDSMGEMPKGNIQTVTIGSEVESLPSDFVRGSLIKTVSIPNSVTSIGDSAFSGCGGLTSVTIPNSVKTIGAGAFYGCDGITNLSFDNAPSSIGDEAFSGCTGLTTLSLGNYVTEIGDKAFYGVWRLTSLVIPNSTTKIGSEAFSGLSQLATLTIGNSVSSIGENAFVGSVIVSTLNWNAKRCQSMGGIPKNKINTVIIGNGVEYLPSDFMKGSLINSIYIPNSITEIGKDAFLNCTRLTTVNIYDITAWCNIKFGNSYSNPIVVPHKLFVNGKELKDLIIPKTVTSIGNYAFYFCNSLNSATFSDSVTKIGAESFRNCNGLTSVTIPNSVTSIGNNAFSGCKNITSLFLDNDNFANISAFNDSKTSVRNIYIGKSVSQINANAFSGCSNLLSATICENVSEIGNNAFAGCSKLNEVTNYSEYPQPINETVFSGVNVKACSLYIMENSYYYYSNVVYWKDFLVKITGVEGVEVDEPQKEIEGYYDLKGIRLEKPIRGQVNIVRYTDGSTKKIVVK